MRRRAPTESTLRRSPSAAVRRGASLHGLGWHRWAAVALLAALLPASPARARERTGSIDVFVALDESGSMKPIFPRVTGFLADAVVRDYLEPGDYLAVIGFSDAARIRVSQQLSSDGEKENLGDILRNLNVVPQGYTDMGRALEETLRQLERLADRSHEQVVLVLTDGRNQPPRDSPYFAPLRGDTTSLAPPSGFNARFLLQVRRLAEKGWRVHVVGIGLETDAQNLAQALGAGHTLLRTFDAEELRVGLASFWDDAISLVAVEVPDADWRPGRTAVVQAHLRSGSDKEREVRLRGARLTALAPRGRRAAEGDASPAITVTLDQGRWPIASRQEARFAARLALPRNLPPGDYTATLAFDIESAVRFFPPQAEIAFHVPSLWERHGRKTITLGAALLLAAFTFVAYRRRPIAVTLVVEGEPDPLRPVRLGIGTAISVGGGATDRLRIAGLPAKVAVLERRTATRFALVSSQPEVVPTVPEYALGSPVEVRCSGAAAPRRTVRFERWRRKRKSSRRPPRTATPPPPRTRGDGAETVDFR